MKYPLMSMGCLVLALATLGPRDAAAGGLKGKVALSDQFLEHFKASMEADGEEKVDYYWKVENGVLPVNQPKLDMKNRLGIALFRKDGQGATGFVPVHPEIKGAMVTPGTVVVTPKTTVKFFNADPFVHQLYSDDLGKLFPPELQSSQQTRQIQFTNPGVYVVKCNTTPHLAGYVVVVEGVVAYKSPDAEGNFVFDALEAGEYVLKVYFDGQDLFSTAVTVTDSEKEKDWPVVEAKLPAPVKKEAKKAEPGKDGKDGKAGKGGGDAKAPAPQGGEAKKPDQGGEAGKPKGPDAAPQGGEKKGE